jgi:hypothetical protein
MTWVSLGCEVYHDSSSTQSPNTALNNDATNDYKSFSLGLELVLALMN